MKDQDIIEPKQLRDHEAKMSSTVQVQAWKESFCIGGLDDEHQDSMTEYRISINNNFLYLYKNLNNTVSLVKKKSKIQLSTQYFSCEKDKTTHHSYSHLMILPR